MEKKKIKKNKKQVKFMHSDPLFYIWLSVRSYNAGGISPAIHLWSDIV